MKINFLKKIIGALGYKLVEKNLVKNKRILNDKFFNLDMILNHLFLSNNIKDIIQIGSNDGKRFDPINKYLNIYDTKTIFVEPIKEYFDKLKLNYSQKKNSIFENIAISSIDGEIDIFKVSDKNIKYYDDHIAGISSLDKNHLIKHKVRRKHISVEKVNCLTLRSLIKKHNIVNLDLLLLDVEGHEGIILNDFFDNVKFRPTIIFEYIHIDNKIFSDVLRKIKLNNYLYSDFDENLICFPAEKSEIFKLSSF
tara:strand:- start:7008 stop:7763 length:756 start_codon:yes stop_codon:yes gene_type:complete